MPAQLRNTMIGVFLIVAIATLVWLVMFLRPSVGDEKQTLYVRFSNINKINVGTRVMFAGKPVGEVTDIEQIFHARETQPTDALGRLYFYQLTLRIDSHIKVYNTDDISIQTSGLLGEKSIAIIPKAPPPGAVPQQITDKTPFYADSIDPIENTFARLSDIGDKLEDTVDLVKNWFQENSASLSHAVASFGSTMDQIGCVAKSVNDEQVVHQVNLGAQSFTSSMSRVNSAVEQMDQDGVFSNMGPLVTNIRNGSGNFTQITQDICDGQGTMGKLFQNDDLYLRMVAILSKADTVMNDINHYGILFNYNKSWQRIRTKRMTELNALNTPAGFKDYFQGEIDHINTSMARISTLIERAQDKTENEKILQSARFKQNFAELLRQVDEMSDNLKLYNQQFCEALGE